MSEDAGGVEDHDEGGAYRGLILAVTDWKVWWITAILFLQLVSLSFTIYFPSKLSLCQLIRQHIASRTSSALTATLGFSTTKTLLLTAPPWVVSAALTFALTWWICFYTFEG